MDHDYQLTNRQKNIATIIFGAIAAPVILTVHPAAIVFALLPVVFVACIIGLFLPVRRPR